jgi:inosine-uridine nucleoside N-ribohydrolase
MFHSDAGALYGWSEDFDLSTYKGTIYNDGVAAMIDIIRNSVDEVVILEIAPCPNLQKALKIAPDIVSNSRIIAMGGSIYLGYNDRSPATNEYNIR